MSFKKVILHIGPHKTGTSSIQKMLFDNRKSLEKKNILYPNFANKEGWGHHIIHKELKQGNLDDKFFLNLSSKNHNTHTLLLSSENFVRCSSDELETLSCLLDCSDIKVIMFLRIPSRRLISLWKETIKHRSNIPISTFLLQHISRPKLSEVINPYITYEKFKLTFKNIKVINYENCIKNNKNIHDIFLQELGIRDHEFKYPKIINKSSPISISESYRIYNCYANNKNEVNINGFLKKYSLSIKFKKLLKELSKVSTKKPFFRTISSKEYERFIEDREINFDIRPNIKEINFGNSQIEYIEDSTPLIKEFLSLFKK